MDPTRRFIAAIDFSDDARNAAIRASLLAREHGAKLELLHVVTESSVRSLQSFVGVPADMGARLIDEAGAALADLAEEISRLSGVDPDPHVEIGDPAEIIAAATERSELVAIGAHGAGGLRDLFLGGVADRVLRKAKRPVLVVKRPPEGPYSRVLVPVAFGRHSLAALHVALTLAPEAHITVFNAFTVPYEPSLYLAGLRQDQVQAYKDTARDAALAGMNELLANLGIGAIRIRRSVENGDAVPLILAKAAESESDLVVIGKQGRSALSDLLLGSVTRHVLSGAEGDVLIVGGEAGTPPADAA